MDTYCSVPPNLHSNSAGCCLPNWLKIGVVPLTELVYNQTGVCTPAKPSPGRTIGRRLNRSVIRHGAKGTGYSDETHPFHFVINFEMIQT